MGVINIYKLYIVFKNKDIYKIDQQGPQWAPSVESEVQGPYEILERIGPMAYRLALPPELTKLHNVFHVSMLRKYRSDGSHILPVQVVQV